LVPVLLVLGALSALAGFENIGLVAFRRELRFDVQFRISLIPRVLQVLITIAVAWEWRTYWALLAGMAVTRVARLVMTYMVHPYRPRFGLRGWRELAGFSTWLWAASLARLVWDRVETVVIGPRFGATGLGLYQIAATVAVLPITELVAPASDVLLAGFSLAQRSGGRAMQGAMPLALALLLLLAPVGLTMSAGAPDVVRTLLGSQWAGAQALVAVIALASLWAPVGYVSRAVLVATGKVRREFSLMTLSAALKVVIIWAVARTHGLTPIAGASLLCSLFETLTFMAQVWPREHDEAIRALRGTLRVVMGGIVTALALRATGLAWASAPMFRPGLAGLKLGIAHLITLSMIALAVFWSSTAALWLLSGRPEGPETILMRVGRSALLRVFERARRTA
jgi:O-antigen/teichoic acid export membrane protein